MIRPTRRLLFFAGKGGVGKTTCAAALALAAAAKGRRILIVSTDPAHSLGDALERRLSSRVVAVRPGGHRTIDAVELDAPRALARWLSAHRAALAQALEHGTWLDAADIDALLELPLPGVDELVGLMEIGRLAGIPGGRHAPGRYDDVVVDTAPTGHALRLLESPDAVAAAALVLDALQEEHRLIRDQLARVGRREAADRLIELLAAEARALHGALRDRARTAFWWVTLPEALSLAEALDGVAALERRGITVNQIVVNRVMPPGPRCPICDRRRTFESGIIDEVRRRLGRGRRMAVVSAAVEEPKGAKALTRIGSELEARAAVQARPRRSVRGQVYSVPPDADVVAPEQLDSDAPTRSSRILAGASLLFVAGKGGVGKTTVAAAIAVRLARANPHARTLLLSTDPAHSLADVLAMPDADIGDVPRSIPGAPPNLFIREVDAARALALRRDSLRQSFDEIAASVGADAVGVDTGNAGQLLELAPPGVDELFGMLSVLDARRDYEMIVVDTAPTGHALRLLELPDAAREWIRVLMRLLLKYRSLVRAGQLGEELVGISRSIRELKDLLRDPGRARVLVVTRAAAVPQLETVRLLDRLRALRLSAPAVLINAMTLHPGACPRCRAVATAERRIEKFWRRRCGARRPPCAIIRTPLAVPPPRGVREIERWAGTWIAKG